MLVLVLLLGAAGSADAGAGWASQAARRASKTAWPNANGAGGRRLAAGGMGAGKAEDAAEEVEACMLLVGRGAARRASS